MCFLKKHYFIQMLKPFLTRSINVGKLSIGGSNPVRIQSMLTIPVTDTEKALVQAQKLFDAGCEMIRITVPGIKEALAVEKFKGRLAQKGLNIPLIADIHFSPKAALTVAGFVEKVRINPGNYFVDKKSSLTPIYTEKEPKEEKKRLEEGFLPLLNVLKKEQKALRIGVNHGSLSERILLRYGNTVEGMVASALEYAEICRRHDFHNFLFSMKASDPLIMVQAYRKLVEAMQKRNWDYPLHLGVTEAGEGEDGRVKSALGIGALLLEGIGDTIRVSLTESPEKEIRPAKLLVAFTQKQKLLNAEPKSSFPDKVKHLLWVEKEDLKDLTPKLLKQVDGLVLSKDCNQNQIKKDIKDKTTGFEKATPSIFSGDKEQITIEASALLGSLLIDNQLDYLCFKAPVSLKEKIELGQGILQAAKKQIFKTEFISCPGCGRTQFDIQAVTKEAKAKMSHLKGLKIAIMGCIVNGPGEMADSDFGLIGAGEGKVNLYVQKNCAVKGVFLEEAVEQLIKLIKKEGKWVRT